MILHNSSAANIKVSTSCNNQSWFGFFFVAGFGVLFKKVRFKYSVLNKSSEWTRSFVLVKSWNSREKLKQGNIRGADLSQKLEPIVTLSLLILQRSIFASLWQCNSFIRNTGLIMPQVIRRKNRTAILRLLLNFMQSVNQQQQLNVLRFN